MTLPMKKILKSSVCFGLGLTAFVPSVGSAKTEVTPYLEVAQVLDAQIKGGNDVLTYSSVAAGVDATVDGSRTQAQLSYRYERRIGWGKKLDDSDNHTGLMRVSHELVRNTLNIEAGALATRTRGDIRGDAPSLNVGNIDNVSQVYSAYAGPTLSTNVGALQVGAAYRLGYTKVEANDFVPAAGQPRLDNFDDSVSHSASASVGMAPDVLPFGWQVSGAYEREDANQLDQRFESKGVRGEVTVPVSPTIALLGGIGYEDIQASERAPLLDATGNAVVNSKGRFVTDPASPRLASYDFDGIYWDVGVAWKPSDRTNLEAYVGRRYGSMSYTGSFTWQASPSSALQIGVYDQVETFGQQLNDSLSNVPTRFAGSSRNPLNSQFNGCIAGGQGSGQAGGCFNSALQSINSSVYRSRGVGILYSAQRGPLSTSVGFGYAQRTFKTPTVPGSTFVLNGAKDESWYGNGNVAYQLDRNSTIDASVFASLYDSGILGAPNVLSTGATSSYNRRFGRNLSATAAVGLYSFAVDGEPGEMNASALLGMRYSF
jgi:hypothetical protein